ncbi:hypothetical protein [uncultured Ramlibacter sp.]|uniref:hypothetical protein n=1 Tax=uncultured Ramlibacter sp. TaxID=260755 RepID=UPI002608A129|nr:hypothetical protein [uncultured Ramlibacter sp.]
MSLPLQAVDRLFTRLTATYGRQFLDLYEGLDSNAIKTSWAHELSGYTTRLADVAWALENLPERAPNAIEFRNLCRKAPTTDTVALPAPPADPARIRSELEKLRPLIAAARAVGGNANLDWARRIVAKKDAGMKVNALPLKMAQEALARKGVAA